MKANIKNIQLTQEQIRCKNHIIDLATAYIETKNKLNANGAQNQNPKVTAKNLVKMLTELREAIEVADRCYGKWFAERCMEIARSLMEIK